MRVIVSKIDQVLYDGEAKELLVPGADGDMTVLPHHSPIVTILRRGTVTARADGKEQSWEIEKGILEVSGDRATVLV